MCLPAINGELMNLTQKISFIGAGNMATSIIGGLIRGGISPTQLNATNVDKDQLARLQAEHGINALDDNISAVADCDILFLSVKPQVLRSVCEEIRDAVQQRRPLIISIAAGIQISSIDAWLGGNLAIVRCMPNTPALVGVGASGLYANPLVTETQKAAAETMFQAIGLTEWVSEEKDLHAVTAVSGSGPAYFFLILEAMEAAGVRAGLSAATARRLSMQTMLGAATMALQSDDDPATLKRKVMSPGGTTERAIESFEKDGLREMFDRAIKAAAKRSEELAQQLGASS